MNLNTVILLLSQALLLTACDGKKPAGQETDRRWQKNELSYATGFMGASKGLTYVLYPKSEEPPAIDADALIPIPIESVVCTSTTHIPILDYLGVGEALVGFPTTDYISSESVRQRIDSGKVVDLGIDANINEEMLVNLQPDLMVGYTMDGDMSQYERLERSGIRIVLNSEYLERHPLGRAEWIKFIAPFFGLEQKADSIFREIEHNYQKTKELAATSAQQPTAFSGIMYGDSWFLPGGQNYASKIMKDANINYIWSGDSSNGFLQLSIETVYEKANSADYWLGVGSFENLENLKEANNRYSAFTAFQKQQVYSFNKRIGATGGVEYLELGYLRPDLIIADLVKICHPGLMENSETFFFFKLPMN